MRSQFHIPYTNTFFFLQTSKHDGRIRRDSEAVTLVGMPESETMPMLKCERNDVETFHFPMQYTASPV